MEKGLDNEEIKISIVDYESLKNEYDYEKIISDLNNQIDLTSVNATNMDYLIAIASGMLCSTLDILWVKEFNLKQGRELGDKIAKSSVLKVSQKFGYKGDDLNSAVRFLEKKFPIPSDGNTSDFGGGLQHHLRDFSHHPTIMGLIFSLLTQFSGKSYGTDTNGNFISFNIKSESLNYIGKDNVSKLINGTIVWFFHLVSDMAGSSESISKNGGTGIPGPILSLAKELSSLPLFKNINDKSLSLIISKFFNGTLLAKHDKDGKIKKDGELRFDLRAELGLTIELGKQSIPVLANDCFVRIFYLIRRLGFEIQEKDIKTISELKKISFDDIKPYNNPTIARMLTISTGVFTTLDISDAIIKQSFVLVNYVGVGRFAVAIGKDIALLQNNRNIKSIKRMYENIERNTYQKKNEKVYIVDDKDISKFGLTSNQMEILYNLEYYKILNDIKNTKSKNIQELKQSWLEEWKSYITKGFSWFFQNENIKINWYLESEIVNKIKKENLTGTWFKIVLLEVTIFKPYFSLYEEKNKRGNNIVSKKYKMLAYNNMGFNIKLGDDYLQKIFKERSDYIKRFRKSYNEITMELNETKEKLITFSGIIYLGISWLLISTVASKIIDVNAINLVDMIYVIDEKSIFYGQIKLLVALKEIFLYDEGDLEYANIILEKHNQSIKLLNDEYKELNVRYNNSKTKEKIQLKKKIKRITNAIKIMEKSGMCMNNIIENFKNKY